MIAVGIDQSLSATGLVLVRTVTENDTSPPVILARWVIETNPTNGNKYGENYEKDTVRRATKIARFVSSVVNNSCPDIVAIESNPFSRGWKPCVANNMLKGLIIGIMMPMFDSRLRGDFVYMISPKDVKKDLKEGQSLVALYKDELFSRGTEHASKDFVVAFVRHQHDGKMANGTPVYDGLKARYKREAVADAYGVAWLAIKQEYEKVAEL